MAAPVNLLVGIVALSLSRRWSAARRAVSTATGAAGGTTASNGNGDGEVAAAGRARRDGATAGVAKPVVEEAAASSAAAPLPLVLAAAALVGFAFFLMELVWYRLLAPLLGGTTYTFGIILLVALAGIGRGRPRSTAPPGATACAPARALRRHVRRRGRCCSWCRSRSRIAWRCSPRRCAACGRWASTGSVLGWTGGGGDRRAAGLAGGGLPVPAPRRAARRRPARGRRQTGLVYAVEHRRRHRRLAGGRLRAASPARRAGRLACDDVAAGAARRGRRGGAVDAGAARAAAALASRPRPLVAAAALPAARPGRAVAARRDRRRPRARSQEAAPTSLRARLHQRAGRRRVGGGRAREQRSRCATPAASRSASTARSTDTPGSTPRRQVMSPLVAAVAAPARRGGRW